jgi:hypothetical protein
MPTPGWLRRQDLPLDAQGRSYIDPPNLDQMLDQYVNWRGNVNGGGYALSNVGSISALGDIHADNRFTTGVGTLIIFRQNNLDEGGELALQNPHDDDTLAIDNRLIAGLPHMRLFHKTNNLVWLDINMGNGLVSCPGSLAVGGGATMSQLTVTNVFQALSLGTLHINRQNATLEGGQVELEDPHTSQSLILDNSLVNTIPHLRIFHSANNIVHFDINMASGVISLPTLPAASPGAGSKGLWYDPATGNVKFAA